MRDLETIMREVFTSYLCSIGVNCNDTMKISELISLIKKYNSSAPFRAIGLLMDSIITEYESNKLSVKEDVL